VLPLGRLERRRAIKGPGRTLLLFDGRREDQLAVIDGVLGDADEGRTGRPTIRELDLRDERLQARDISSGDASKDLMHACVIAFRADEHQPFVALDRILHWGYHRVHYASPSWD
jgi:hypothetical protein